MLVYLTCGIVNHTLVSTQNKRIFTILIVNKKTAIGQGGLGGDSSNVITDPPFVVSLNKKKKKGQGRLDYGNDDWTSENLFDSKNV